MTRRPIALAVVGLAAIAAVFGWVRLELPPFDAGGSAPDAADVPPPGRWSRVPAFLQQTAGAGGGTGEAAEAGEEVSSEERARLLSLPYSAGGGPAEPGADSGVVFHDRGRAAPGINLYASGHASEALLVDMEGRPLWRWRYPFERAFPGRAPTIDTPFFRRVELTPDGRLIALYQTGGLILLDQRSRLLAAHPGGFYNDFFAAPDGRI
jgi:hypothetical protein